MKTVPRPLVIIAFAATLVSAEGYAEEPGLSSLPDEGLSLRLARHLVQAPDAARLALPSATRSGRTQLALRSARENLSNGSPDWTDSGLEVVHEFERRKVLIGSFVESSRYGLTDRTLTAEGYYPFSERATGYLLVAASDTHLVLARDTVHAQLAYALRDGWGVMAGLKHATYNATVVDIADLTVERYFSDFRAAFTVLPAHSSTAGNATSYRFQFGYYYGEENRVQLFLSRGTEVDRPAGESLIAATTVRGNALAGRHWLSGAWALDYVVARTVQGSVIRTGAGVGLRYRF